MLDVCGGSFACDGVLISEDQDTLILAEQAVNVFEFAVGCFGVESDSMVSLSLRGNGGLGLQIDDGDERSIEDGPDDVEFPVQGLDANGGNLNDHD